MTIKGWATNENHPAGAGAWNGQPTKVEPSAGKIAAGFAPEEKFNTEQLNWLLDQALSQPQIDLVKMIVSSWSNDPGLVQNGGTIPNLGSAPYSAIYDPVNLRLWVPGSNGHVAKTTQRHAGQYNDVANWVACTTPDASSIYHAAAPGASGRLVVVGSGANDVIYTTNATAATPTFAAAATPPTGGGSDDCYSVLHDTTNSLFITILAFDGSIWTSPDTDGSVWTKRTTPVGETATTVRRAIAQNDSGELIALTDQNVYTSTNGTTWVQVTGQQTAGGALTQATHTGDRFIIGSTYNAAPYGEVFVSDDAGATWTRTLTMPGTGGWYGADCVLALGDVVLVAGTDFGRNVERLHVSATSGDTWSAEIVQPFGDTGMGSSLGTRINRATEWGSFLYVSANWLKYTHNLIADALPQTLP